MKILINLNCLSDDSHRYDLKSQSYDDYHKAHGEDKVNKRFADLLQPLAEFYDIVVYSTMPEEYRLSVETWLIDNEIPADEVLMRPEGDYSKSYEVILGLIDNRDKIAAVFETDQRVVEILRDDGILVFES